jgi:hypothetical protein
MVQKTLTYLRKYSQFQFKEIPIIIKALEIFLTHGSKSSRNIHLTRFF